jgi:hypothetical protein
MTGVNVFLVECRKASGSEADEPANSIPPRRQVFRVEIQNDGAWRVLLNGDDIACGDNAVASCVVARNIIEQHCSGYL